MDGLRESLTAAFDSTEVVEPVVSASSEPIPAVIPAVEAKSVESAPAPSLDPPEKNALTETITSDKPTVTKDIAEVVAETPAKPTESGEFKIDRAPQSWKGDAKKVWDTLPANVRQEVVRRERDTTKVLQEGAHDRQQVHQLQEVLAPHMERINEVYKGNPLTAINNMLGIERTLMRGTSADKAQLVANVIKHFEINLEALDSLLAGQELPAAQSQLNQVEQLLSQRLAPLMSFVEKQQLNERQQAQQVEQQAAQTIEGMAADPQFPYFEEVRGDMADLIELSAKKGLYLSLPEAYNKAVRMNDVASQASDARTSSQAATQAALAAHQQAQRAKGAAVSVSGSPSSPGLNIGNPVDLRGTIATAMESMGGRV